MPTDNKAIARRMFEKVWNEGKLELLPELVTPTSTLLDPNIPVEGTGPEAVKGYARAIRTAFPDIVFTFTDQIAEGDKVVNVLKITATHEGEFMGIPPTHKKSTVYGMVFQTFVNGKVTEALCLWDALSFVKTAGVVTLPKEAFAAR